MSVEAQEAGCHMREQLTKDMELKKDNLRFELIKRSGRVGMLAISCLYKINGRKQC
jgi:hypothetical protein